MKKIIIALFVLVSNIQIFSQVKLDNLKMKKLGKEEYLDYVYLNGCGKYNLKIFKIDKDENPIEDLFFINHQYGNIQISEDRKMILLSGEGFHDSNTKLLTHNYYLIDGKKGKVKYTYTLHPQVITSSDFKYFLTIEDYTEEKGYKIAVRKVNDGKVLKTFFWKTGTKSYGGLTFLRSKDSNYDFRIIYTAEISMYGECFYRVKDNKLYETLNDTFDTREYINKYSCSYYEEGLVSRPDEKMKNENWEQ